MPIAACLLIKFYNNKDMGKNKWDFLGLFGGYLG
jgi:hypothetical protein